MRVGMAGLVALILVLLSACTGLGNPDETKACRALADQAPSISGVTQATFTLAISTGISRCSGDVRLEPGLTTAQRGQVIGSVYDIVRERGLKAVQFNTAFALGSATLQVSSGFPTAAQATSILDVADQAHADRVELATSPEGFAATLHAPLTSTTPAASLREGIGFLRTAAPPGFRAITWRLNDSQIVSTNLTADQAAQLEAIAVWFERNPAVTSYSLTWDRGVQTWALITSQEVPDVVRTFPAAGSGTTVKVSGSLAGKAPYVTIP